MSPQKTVLVLIMTRQACGRMVWDRLSDAGSTPAGSTIFLDVKYKLFRNEV
jgi:hypothetical protein